MASRSREEEPNRVTSQSRSLPDEQAADAVPEPQPEHAEPKLPNPGLRDLSRADWIAIIKRAAKKMLDNNMTMIASALAYSSFLAMPSVLLVVIGLFTLIASPATITTVIAHLHGVMPAQATQLLGQSLQHLEQQRGSSVTITIVGLVLALWSTTGAMTSYMTALNLAYERKDQRKFLQKRLIALAMVACIGAAFVLIAVFLIFGPQIEKHLGHALGIQSALAYIWWVGQWPILIGGLLAAFATLLWLGPNVDQPKWQFLTVGSALAVFIWLIASGAFAIYTAQFGSYNKTWGSLAAVIIMLTWLWLTALALLFGAEVNAEVERSRELREGQPAQSTIQAPARA